MLISADTGVDVAKELRKDLFGDVIPSDIDVALQQLVTAKDFVDWDSNFDRPFRGFVFTAGRFEKSCLRQ